MSKLYCMIEGDRCYGGKEKSRKKDGRRMDGDWAVCNFK